MSETKAISDREWQWHYPRFPCGASRLKSEPFWYVQWFHWADKMAKTYEQDRCPKCGLWHIWRKKKSSDE